jgi:hypothetical protein
MHIPILSQHVGWFGGKGNDLHPWGLKISSYNDMGCVVNARILTEYSLPT